MFKSSLDRLYSLEYGYKINPTSYQTVHSRIVDTLECANSQTFHLPTYMGDTAPPFSCDFSNQNPDYLLISKEDGLVHLFDVEEASRASAHIADFEAHCNAIFDVKWTLDDSKFLTAAGDQSIRLFDVHTRNFLQEFTGHSMSVKYLSFRPTCDEVFASASRDGSIRVWDRRLENYSGKPTPSIIVLSNCHTNYFMNSEQYKRSRLLIRKKKNGSKESQGVTCVKFLSDHLFLSSGSTDCSLKLWDMRFLGESSKQKVSPVMTYTYKGVSQRFLGYSDICLNESRTRMYALCNDSTIYEYDMQSMSSRPTFLYSGHSSNSFYIKMDISYDSKYLVCGSDAGNAVVYTIGDQEQNPIILPARNVSEVSVAKWSKNCPTRLVTLYDNAHASIWNCHPARHYEPVSDPDHLYGMAYRSGQIKKQSDLLKNVIISPPNLISTPSRSMAETSGQRSSFNSPSCSSSGEPVTSGSFVATPKRDSHVTSFNLAVHTPPPSHVVSPLTRLNKQLNIREFVVASPTSDENASPLTGSRSVLKARRKTLVKRPRLNSTLFAISDNNKENISPHSFSKLIHNSENEEESPETPKKSDLFEVENLPVTPSINPRKRLSLMTSNEVGVGSQSEPRQKKRRKTLFPPRSDRKNSGPRQALLGIESYFL